MADETKSTTSCSKCGKLRAIGERCKPCRRASASIYQRGYYARHPERVGARIAVTKAVASGRLDRGACADCDRPPEIVKGKQIIEAHHASYERSQRLIVTWLCRPCHDKRHRVLGPALPSA